MGTAWSRWRSMWLTMVSIAAVAAFPATTVASPGPASALSGVRQLSSEGLTCALVAGGEARCWGSNVSGAVGDGTTTDRTRPTAVRAPAGGGHLSGVLSVSVGEEHSCFRLSAGTVRCVGANDNHQIGDGTSTRRARPTLVRAPSGPGILVGIRSIEAGAYHTCAILESTQVRCWGVNAAGQLGDGTTKPRTRPVVVKRTDGKPLSGVVQLALGLDFSCARLASGQVRCWGADAYGQLGNGPGGSSTRPVKVLDDSGTGPLDDVAQLTAANASACARLVDRQVRCWGKNATGQLGDGTTGTQYDLPVAVQNPAGTGPLGGVAQVSMGYGHACARLTSDQLLCWGDDYAGALGNGPGGPSPLPAFVLKPSGVGALSGAREVSAGIDFTCARLAGGQARCWGYNGFGQVGDGTKDDRQLPVVVGG